MTKAAMVAVAMVLGGCASSNARGPIAIRPDSSLASSISILRAAADLWNAIGAQVDIVDESYSGHALTARLIPLDQWKDTAAIGHGVPDIGIEFEQRTWDEVAAYNPQADRYLTDLAAHEIGHVVGCWHVEDLSSVMNPQIHPQAELSTFDIAEFEIHGSPTAH